MLYTRIQRRTYGSWKSLGFCSFFQRNFQLVSTFLSTFSHFWKSAITIEVFNEKDCSLLSMLYCDSLQQNTFLSFWNVESYYHMFACIRRSKTLSAFHCTKNSRNSGWKSNGKVCFCSFQPENSRSPLEVVHFNLSDQNCRTKYWITSNLNCWTQTQIVYRYISISS